MAFEVTAQTRKLQGTVEPPLRTPGSPRYRVRRQEDAHPIEIDHNSIFPQRATRKFHGPPHARARRRMQQSCSA